MEPLKFNALLKSTIWGGEKIIPFKHLDVQQENVGESWEISGVPGNETVVANGEYAGKKLNELVHELKGKLVGEANYQRFGDEFPLLIKFIDARQDLSIQVHPTDEIAKRQGKERGKTEMWYLLPSDADATLLCGLKQQITPTQYAEMVENDTICDAISRYDVKEGDCFFLPAGRIHAIGTAASSQRYSRHPTLHTASTTLSARTRTATIASCTQSRLQSASTTMLRATTVQSTRRRRTRAYRSCSVLTSTQPYTISMSR